MSADQQLVLGLVGVSIPILSAAFWYTHSRIIQVRDDARQDLEDLQQQLTERLKDGHNDRQLLRQEMLTFHAVAARQHEDILTRLGEVATRDEIKGDIQRLEDRLALTVRNQEQRTR